MKKNLIYIAALLVSVTLFAACSKSDSKTTTPAPSYAAKQGVITGTGAATFNLSGASTVFSKNADTISIAAVLEANPTVNGTNELLLAFQAPSVGSHSFDDVFDHILDSTFQAPSAAIRIYVDTNSAGTVIVHEFASKSGTYAFTYYSTSGITGTYNVTMNDYNNNGEAPQTISGTFSGNF